MTKTWERKRGGVYVSSHLLVTPEGFNVVETSEGFEVELDGRLIRYHGPVITEFTIVSPEHDEGWFVYFYDAVTRGGQRLLPGTTFSTLKEAKSYVDEELVKLR